MVACQLFVPKVKDSVQCGVCHLPLQEHRNVPQKPPIRMEKRREMVGGSVALRAPKGIRPAVPQIRDLNSNVLSTKGQTLTLSERSAFQKVNRRPPPISTSASAGELSKDKMPLPAALDQKLVRPKPTALLQPYLNASASPNNASSTSSPVFRSARESPRSPSPTPNAVFLVASDKEVVSRANNFKQILSRFQNAADEVSPKPSPTRRIPKSASNYADRRQSCHFPSDITLHQADSRMSASPSMLEVPKKPPSLTITIPTPKNKRRPLSLGPRDSSSSASDEVVSVGVSSPLTSPSFLSHVSVSPPSLPRKSPTTVYSPRTLCTPTSQNDFTPLKRSTTGSCRRILSQTSISSDRPPRRAFLSNRIHNRRNRNENERSSSQLNLDELGNSQVPFSPASDVSGRSSVNPLYVDDSGNSSSNSVGDKRNSAIIEKYNQITVGHMKTLAFVSNNLWEQIHFKEQVANSAEFSRVNFSDFMLKSAQPFLVKGRSLFFYASLDGFDEEFTLMVAPSCQYGIVRSMAGGNMFRPPIMAEIEDFNGDLRNFLRNSTFERTTIAHRVLVMPHLNICSFHTLAAHHLHKTMDPSRLENVVCFTMIQLLAALKSLQSDGVESLSINFKEFMLAFRLTNFAEGLYDLREYPQLIFLQESMDDDLQESHSEEGVGICKYALRALCTLLHHKMHSALPEILDRSEYSSALRIAAQTLHSDKSSSLTRAKNILDFAFWGRNAHFDSELDAKLWLDQQRATQIDRLIHLLVEQNTAVCEPKERLFVQFLLTSTPRTLFQCSQSLQDQFL